MKIYGTYGSACTQKVQLTLAEKGQEATFIPIDLGRGEQKAPEHLARHPFGVVPVLEDDGFVLYESGAIIRYLDARFAPASLTPAGLEDLARMAQWLSVAQSYLAAPVGVIRFQLVIFKFMGRAPDMALVEKARVDVEKTLDVVEKALEGRDYLAGGFSLAEVVFLPELETLARTDVAPVLTSRPNVNRWFQRIRSRPAWQKVLEQSQRRA